MINQKTACSYINNPVKLNKIVKMINNHLKKQINGNKINKFLHNSFMINPNNNKIRIIINS